MDSSDLQFEHLVWEHDSVESNPSADYSMSCKHEQQDQHNVTTEQAKAQTKTPAKNELRVAIVFEPQRRIETIALLDTGSMDNWVAEEFCDEHNLRYEDREEEAVCFRDASGHLVIPLGTLNAEWRFRCQTRLVIFRVARKLPRSVIFGYTLMFACKMIKDNFDTPLAPIVAEKMKREERRHVAQGEARVAMEACDVEAFRQWRKSMLDKKWLWCDVENRFYKLEGNNKKRYPDKEFYLEAGA